MTRRSRKKKNLTRVKHSAYQRLEMWVKVHARHLLIGILALNLLFSLVLFEPKPHTGGDNAAYILLAESILRSGDGYAEGYRSVAPEPQTQYPFGYPLLLSPLSALFGRNILDFKLLSLAMILGSVALFSILIRPLFAPLPWAALTLAAAVNPVMIDYSHWILSESAFLFFSLLSFALFLTSEKKGRDSPGTFFWLALLCMAFTLHIRTIGIAFPLAGFAYYSIHRKWRKLALFTVVMTMLVLPWMIRNRMVQQGNAPYVEQILLKSVYDPDQGHIGFAGLGERVIKNVRIYSSREMGRVLIDTTGAGKLVPGVRLAAVLLTLIVLAGFVKNLITRKSILEFYMLFYTGAVLIFPDVVSDVRYLMPLIPLILLYLGEGGALAARLPLSRMEQGGKIVVGLALAAALISFTFQMGRVPGNLSMLKSYLSGDRYAGYPPNWRNLFQAGDWIRENTSQESVITVRKPRLFHVHTGRKVEGYPFTADTDSVLNWITATDYVVVDAVSGTTYRYLIPAIQKAPERFKLLYRLENPFTGVLEVVK